MKNYVENTDFHQDGRRATSLKVYPVIERNKDNKETIVIACHSIIDTCAVALDSVAEYILSTLG